MQTKMFMLVVISAVFSYSQASLPHTQCTRTYEKVGGFIEKDNRVFPELLINDRDSSSDKYDGHDLVWKAFEDSIHSLACRCAVVARKKGYKVFALQFYGECWSGPNAESNQAKYGPADPSKSFQFLSNPAIPCDKSNEQECVGGPLINYVYKLKDKLPSCAGAIKLGGWMLSSSSDFKYRYRAAKGKIKFNGGGRRTGSWIARYKNANQWLLADFDRPMKITRISSQGRPYHNQWVKAFTVDYSDNGVTFKPYEVNGIIKVFSGNTDPTSVVSHKLTTPIVAQYIRIKPTAWSRRISMRVGMHGCPTGQKPASPPCHQAMDVGIIMDRSGSIGAENFKRSQDFVAKLISHFQYASSGTRFGVIAYNANAKVILKFSDTAVQNQQKVIARVYGIPYLQGRTRTDKALKLANINLFSSSGGYRSNVPNVLFVLTDGKTNKGSTPYPTVLIPLLKKKVNVIAVGIGAGISGSELNQISTKAVFHLKDFKTMSDKLNDILNSSCP